MDPSQLPSHSGGMPQPPFFVGNQMDMPGEEGEAFDFFGVLNRRKWLVFLGLVTGMGLGGLYHANSPLVYESKANIRIEPKAPRIFNVSGSEAMLPSSEDDILTRHDRMIGQDFLVRLCLEKNGLNNLPSFQDVADDEVVLEVMDNLAILPDREDPFFTCFPTGAPSQMMLGRY